MTQQAEADPLDYLGGTWLSDGNSSLAELKEECRETSLILAQSFRALSCQIHERCDGSCGSYVGDQENLMIDPEDLVSFMLFGAVAETRTTSQDVPRDKIFRPYFTLLSTV